MISTGKYAILVLLTGATVIGAARPALAKEAWRDAIDRSERLKQEARSEEAERELRAFLEQGGGARLPAAAQASLHHDLGSLCQDRGSGQEAMQHYKRAITAWEQAGQRYRLHLSSTLSNLASLLWEDGRLTDASRTLQRAVAIQQSVNVPNSELPRILYNLSTMHLALGREEEGREVLRQLVALPRQDGDTLLNTAAGSLSLGRLLRSTGQGLEADSHYKRGLALWAEWRARDTTADFDPGLMTDLAVELSKGPAQAEALAAADVLLSWIDRQGSAAGLRTVPALRAAAKILRQANRKSEARMWERRAKTILAASQEQLSLRAHQVDVQTLHSRRARR